jgi:hypothetical protein
VRTDVEERAKSTLSDAVHRCERSFVLNDATAVYFVRREDVRRCSSFCALPHPFNWVAFTKVVTTAMIKQQTH